MSTESFIMMQEDIKLENLGILHFKHAVYLHVQ